MFLLASTLVIILLAFGLYHRHDKKKHIPLMLTAFVIDLSLVLIIEIQRKAVESVVDNVVHAPNSLVIFHAIVSLLVIVLYIGQIITGTKIARGKRYHLALHQQMAVLFIVLRLTNYITSFQMADLI